MVAREPIGESSGVVVSWGVWCGMRGGETVANNGSKTSVQAARRMGYKEE